MRLRLRLLLLLLLAGCATLDTVRADNREHLTRLMLGMTREQVLAAMGTGTQRTRDGGRITNPYRAESYSVQGKRIDVLFYYTDLKARDDAITDDELTPIVLVDGRVDGWGWSYWQALVQRYEIRVR
jgi:hypothetical protein